MRYVILVAAIAVFLMFMYEPKKKAESMETKDYQDAFRLIFNKYGREKAETVERLFRLETAHFKSGQFLHTLTPGMEIAKGKFTFPYGWSSLQEFANETGLKAGDFSTYTMNENQTGKEKTFIAFPNLAASVLFVAYLLNKRNWNAGSWYSTNPSSQQSYTQNLNKIVPKIVNSL
jgi:hypothetical protein